jgi:hypothetical protein
MQILKACSVAVMFGLCAAPVLAETQSEIVFQHKHWQVEIDAFDDGSFACQAAVDAGNESFTIWVFQDQSVRLQFYSTDWAFTDGETANLEVQIDRRGAWTLSNAELTGHSAIFDLPDSDAGVRFLIEVAQGQRAYLRNDTGDSLRDYSLQGSRASMDALIACTDAIK